MKVDFTLIKIIHKSISLGSTGCPDCFSKKLGISKSSFHDIREFMNVELEAGIVYCRNKKTYYYREEFELYIGNLHTVRTKLLKGIADVVDTAVRS